MLGGVHAPRLFYFSLIYHFIGLNLMFLDTVTVFVKSGRGGDGCVSFYREKYHPKGGPDGGDGGDGGSVILVGDTNLNNLSSFKHTPKLYAGNGQPGMAQRMFGKKGKDVKIRVPCGTIVKNLETQEVICEILNHDEKIILASGGKGGKGNWHYATSTNQAPRQFEHGRDGVSFKATFELKMIADVGLLGLPNAGKSSLVTAVSNARPKIANYPFTTLSPHLGVVALSDFRTVVMADIPGIIEGASDGKGLGIQFLKHVERTQVLLYVIDISPYADTAPAKAFKLLKKEIEKFGKEMPQKKFLIAANKTDLDPNSESLDAFIKAVPKSIRPMIYPISTASKTGIRELIEALDKLLYVSPKKSSEDLES